MDEIRYQKKRLQLAPFYPILDVGHGEALHRLERHLSLWQSCEIPFYQLRFKGSIASAYLKLAEALKQSFPDLAIIANDFYELALGHTELFSGFHIGQSDLSLIRTHSQLAKLEAQPRQHRKFCHGLSTHSFEQIRAQIPVPISWDYLALGPCYASKSKGTSAALSFPSFHLAVQAAQEYYQHSPVTDFQLVLIGGINAENIDSLLSRIQKAVKIKTKSKMGRRFLSQDLAKPLQISVAAIQAACKKEEILQITNRVRDYNMQFSQSE